MTMRWTEHQCSTASISQPVDNGGASSLCLLATIFCLLFLFRQVSLLWQVLSVEYIILQIYQVHIHLNTCRGEKYDRKIHLGAGGAVGRGCEYIVVYFDFVFAILCYSLNIVWFIKDYTWKRKNRAEHSTWRSKQSKNKRNSKVCNTNQSVISMISVYQQRRHKSIRPPHSFENLKINHLTNIQNEKCCLIMIPKRQWAYILQLTCSSLLCAQTIACTHKRNHIFHIFNSHQEWSI